MTRLAVYTKYNVMERAPRCSNVPEKQNLQIDCFSASSIDNGSLCFIENLEKGCTAAMSLPRELAYTWASCIQFTGQTSASCVFCKWIVLPPY